MSRAEVETTTTLEENFMFGSPPLLKGFAYNSCRSQESHGHIISYPNFEYADTAVNIENNSPKVLDCESNMFRCQSSPQRRFPFGLREHEVASACLSGGVKETPPTFYQKQKQQTEANFIKRKDLRTLRTVLSKERFRQVVMKFGSFDDEGQEILDSVHQTMKSINSSKVKCLFCPNMSQIYENFPVVDGTLFLSPIKLSSSCIPYYEKDAVAISNNRFMCFVCVHCMDGKPENIACRSCGSKWNGSFYQIGTLYAYNILSAIPCCQNRVMCSNCRKPVLNVGNGEASSLCFSHFSRKTLCPHCQKEDYHCVKSLSESIKCIRVG